MNSSTTSGQLNNFNKFNDRIVELLALCEFGDETALEELYSHCSAQLYGVLIRILKIEAVAEEALQDTFINIWIHAGKFRSASGTPMVWLYSIARHRALDILRQLHSRESLETTDISGLIESTTDFSKPISEMSDDAALLIDCLDALPEGPRLCIIKAYCEGYSSRELSEVYEHLDSTIKSWLRRGLASLKECLDEHS